MKTKIFSISLLILFITVFACISKKEIIKKFNNNGTIEVTVNTFENDTNYLHNYSINPFPMKPDKRWALSFTRDTGKKIRCTAVKDFSSLIMLQKTFILNNSKWEKLNYKLSFKKKFRWFYTNYCYNETFFKINPFDLSPKDFLSDEEMQLWKNRDDELVTRVNNKRTDSINSVIDNKAENWLKSSFKRELVLNLKKALEILNDPLLKPSMIEDNIDTILNLCPGDYSTKKLIAAMAGYFQDEKVYLLLGNRFSFLNATEKKYESILDNFHEEAVFKTILPGTIIENNATKINDDTLCWSVTAYKFFFNNYELKATSRVINRCAYWVTGVIILLIIGFVVLKRQPKTGAQIS